jgi:hypothetical protein
MTKPHYLKWKIAASLVCLALLTLVSSASAVLVVTGTFQNPGTSSFDPTATWTVATDSLIAGMSPTTQAGTFTANSTTPGVSALTDGVIGPVSGSLNIYANAGPSAGTQAIYTLPVHANGYNLTNITVYSGWANGGRSAQGYTVLYSTVANPANFIFLTNVTYTAGFSGTLPTTPITLRVQLTDSAGGAIAANVGQVQFLFSFPTAPNGENGGSGYSEITVEGTVAASVLPAVAVMAATQTGTANTWPFTPTWTLETDSLIAGNTTEAGNVITAGNFSLEIVGRVVDSLTAPGGSLTLNEVAGTSGTTTSPNYVTCGGGSGSGSPLIYTLTNSVNGSDVTNIVIYNGWADNGRFGQYYNVSYSTVSAPTTYNYLTTIYYLPSVAGSTPVANRVAIFGSTGAPLAKNVANLKFDFASLTRASSFNNGYQGYAQIIVEGTNSAPPLLPPSPYLTQDTLPSYAETVVGDQVIFSAAYSNAPPANLQWQQVVGGAMTNNINTGVVYVTNSGVVTSTLTLNNVQTNNSGSYRLQGLNATNGAAAPSYSTVAPLVVGSVPAAVGNVIVEYAGQCGLGNISLVNASTNFYPTWPINTTNDLILGAQIGSGATYSTPGAGNFGSWSANPDPTILSDGSFGFINYWPNVGGSQTECTCGVSPGGQSMTYTFDTSITGSTNGYDITNIVVYGGWGDGGRNEQKYQVYYTTVGSANQTLLVLVDYNPNDPNNTQSATRTTLIPTGTALVQHVSSIEFNFNLQGAPPKNGQEGYSEFVVAGTASGPSATPTQGITPLTAEDVQGSSVTFVAGFSGADSVQWQKNGTNIPGANSMTLTLTNLHFSDTATNGGYSLTASNRAGIVSSGACPLIVDPAPAVAGNIVKAYAYQTGAGNFSPTWDTSSLTNSLIYQQNPPSGGYDTGNFNDPDVAHPNTAGGLPVLTDGNYGFFVTDGSHPAFATCGNTASSAGKYVIYTLGANANGYNVTNIQIAGGWNDNGRNAQWYTVKYSTVAIPTTFLPLVVITNSPTFNNESVIRTTITPAAGLLASNVYAVEVDFATPPGVPNGYSGYSEISVFGSPATTPLSEPPAGAVYNPSFEFDVALGVGQTVATVPTSWTAFNAAADTDIGSENAGGTDYTVNNPLAATAAGNQYCYINMFNPSVTGGIYQDVGALQPNTPYALTVAIGSRADRTNSPGIISLINGTDNTGTVLASGGGLPATHNTWQDYTVTFTTGATISGDLTVALSVLGDATLIQADFDNVRLTTTPIAPTLGAPKVSGGKLILTGTGGTPNSGYTWLTTTKLSPPIIWTTNSTGTLDGTGSFSNSIPINVTNPASFFRLRMP